MADSNSNSELVEFDPILTSEQINQAERAAQSFGVTRRCAFASMTRTCEQMERMDEEAGGVFIDLVEKIDNYLEWREAETEILAAARARILYALSKAFPEQEVPNHD